VYGGSKPSRLVDTQLAAALLGFPPQISLQALLEDVLGVRLEKLHARTDWSQRPLGAAELRYALDDVAHLAPLWAVLEQRLRDAQRLHWFAEDCAALLAEPHTADPLQLWARLPGISRLEPEQQAAALSLIEWREDAARRLDRPRRWVLQDEAITGLARALPVTAVEIAKLRDLPRRLTPQMVEGLLAALVARHDPTIARRLTARGDSGPADRDRVKAAQERVKQHAAGLGIVPEVLATRREIEQFVAGRGVTRTEWRMAALREILEVPETAAAE
jgi:ribonuclease D